MKSATYKETEKLLKNFPIYNKILEFRNEENIKEKVSQINNAMGCLNNLERKIITDFFINNKNMLEISIEINLTREYTSTIKTKAIRKIEKIIFGSEAA